jgi:uncharacterized delta-60 repeat protein
MRGGILRAVRRRRGATGFAYGLLVGLIAVTAIGAVTGLGGAVGDLFGATEDSLTILDTEPEDFAFTDVTGEDPGAEVSSNAVTLGGINAPVTAVCGGGCTEIARNGAWSGATSLGGFNSGDTIAIRQTASASYSTAVTASVTVGGVASADWSVTTRALDGTPDGFSFTDQPGATPGATVDSNAVPVGGFDGTLTAACGSGCTDIARNNSWAGATSLGGFEDGDTIAVRQVASGSYLTPTTATVSLGPTTSGTWTVTTAGPPPASLDSSFTTTGSGFNNIVYAIAVGSTGKIVTGGSFTNYNGVTRGRIARLNSDGTLDTGFAPAGTGLGGTVYDVAIQADGKVVAVGTSTSYNGSSGSYRAARFNTDGTRDTGFNLTGGGFNSTAYAVRVLADQKILVGGAFSNYDTTARRYVARLNTDGTLDGTFATDLNAWTGNVRALCLQSNGGIVFTGNFAGFNQTYAGRMFSDGTLDTAFTPAPYSSGGLSSDTVACATQSDDRIVVAGYSGAPSNSKYVMRYNAADGSRDTGFTQTGGGTYNAVFSVALQSDGKVIAGGSFPTYNGIDRNRIMRLNGNGTLDTSFVPPTAGFNADVQRVFIQPDGKILVGGGFTSYGSTTVSRIVRLTAE